MTDNNTLFDGNLDNIEADQYDNDAVETEIETEVETEVETQEVKEVEDPEFKRDKYVPQKFLRKDGTVDVENLSKSYTELEKQIRAPETYDESFLKENNLSFGEGETATEWRNEVYKTFKGANLTQKQVNAIMPLYSHAVQQLVSQFGPPQIDVASETASLTNVWGDPDSEKFKQKYNSALKFAKSLPQDVLTKPLHKTSAGIQLLEKMARTLKGPQTIQSEKLDSASVQTQLRILIEDPAYEYDKGLQKKAEHLASVLAKFGK